VVRRAGALRPLSRRWRDRRSRIASIWPRT
jgi:hypothetical protein